MKILDWFYGLRLEERNDGAVWFFPWGKFFKGRVLKTEYQEKQIKKYLKFHFFFLLPLFVVAIFFIHITDIFIVFVLFDFTVTRLILRDEVERE